MYVLPESEKELEEIRLRISGLIKASPQGTRKELSEFLGIHANVITNWLNGRNRSWRGRLDEIAKYFGVSTAYLLGADPEEQKEKAPDQKAVEPMTPEELIRERILQKYKSIRSFTNEIDVSYSTVDSMLKRGIAGAGVGTVYKVCRALNLDIDDLLGDKSDKKKEPPAPSEDDTGEVSIDEVIKAFVAAGLVKEGKDLTDSDLRFLISIVDAIRTWFAAE